MQVNTQYNTPRVIRRKDGTGISLEEDLASKQAEIDALQAKIDEVNKRAGAAGLQHHKEKAQV
eukprot:COSAG06_NODE_67362_length_252_cov_0.673203_1_plen_62_part_10